ncbi:DUF6785 family protein [Armatimonas sp.]|uniref:DUF6785 family protein n=1 Tax=Armatimonas sp. TaxID=1872638 RepID=UPI00374CA06D
MQGITVRAVLLGALLAALNAVWVTAVEVRYYILDGSSLPLFVTPIFLLFLLVGGNRLLGKRKLRQEELLTAYLMAVISNTFAGHDMLQNLFGVITHPYYFAAQNHWQEVFIEKLPAGLFVRDEAALNGWYRGNIPLERMPGFLVHWIVPLTLWGLFFLTLTAHFLFITLLVRRAWTESERLAFPVIQLPLAMTEPSGQLFRQPLMWMGFGLAFLIGLVNGIHELYPQVPNAPWIKLYDVGQFFTSQPWEAIRTYGMQTSLYPFAIGLAYFIPLDLAFSCWFSYLLARGYFVVGRFSGLDGPSAAQGWPFLKEISSGAWLGVAAAILWANRRHLTVGFDAAFGKGTKTGDARWDRAAWLGLALTGALLAGWSVFLLNMSPVVTAGFFLVLMALSLAITRVRAEFGTPHEIVFVKPADMLVTLFGTRALGDVNLIGMQAMYWFNRGYRCHPIPNFLEGMKMAEGRKMGLARLIGAFTVAALVSLVTTYAANYIVTYDAGAQGKATGYKVWVGREAFDQLSSWIKTGQPAGSTNLYFFLGGLGVVAALAGLRNAFVTWPFHPTGFALGVSYAMNYFWLCVFVAWFTKLLLIRYGGMTAHRRAIPFFLGLILGDYTVGALWSLLSLLLGQATYKIYI